MNRSHKIFTDPLLEWHKKHGRTNLPWQHPRSAYRVWLSEIMLQQTQVKTVIPYFKRFLTHFPDIKSLANASEDEVLALWSGLGYYSRARNLHRTALIIDNEFEGEFPQELNQLMALPGIGASTAAAIASQAFEKATAILDGNVKRVLSRFFMLDGYPEQASIKKKFWSIANECMPEKNCSTYTQAIMDMGATCCTAKNPQCEICPLKISCLAYKHNEVQNYPHKKPKIKLPNKYQLFLLFHNEQKIYLEKRPPTGIWGGLWCLPSISLEDEPIKYAEKTYQLKIKKTQQLLAFKHTFSHFHLHIQSIALQSELKTEYVQETTGRWVTIEEIQHLGLAKPVKDIVLYFNQSSNVDNSSEGRT